MRRVRLDWASKTGNYLVLAILCATLFLFATTVQQAHFHPDGLTHSDCTICHTAPHVAQPSTCCSIRQAPLPSARVVLSIEPAYRANRFSKCQWNRPPPDHTAV